MKNWIYIGLGVLSILIWLLPYVILGEDAYITIHDFLDSNVVHENSVISMGFVGNPQGLLPILDGVPCMKYMSLIPLNIKVWLYIMLPTYWAIVLNILFVKVSAFVGMYLLCADYFFKEKRLYSFCIALCFALVPFYVDYGLSSAGVPLFLYAVLNIHVNKKLFLSFFILFLFACNSSFFLSGIFLCMIWGIWIIYYWISSKLFPKRHVVAYSLLVIIYILCNFTVIYNYIMPTGIVSHRSEFSYFIYTLTEDIQHVYGILWESHYHAGSFFSYPLLLVEIAILLIYYKTDKSVKYYLLSLIVLTFLMFVGFHSTSFSLPFFNAFSLQRIFFIFPALCFILLAKSISIATERKRLYLRYSLSLIIIIIIYTIFVWSWKVTFIFVLAALFVNYLLRRNLNILNPLIILMTFYSVIPYDKEYKENINRLTNGYVGKEPSFKQFYDVKLFDIIKSDLGITNTWDCKVVSLGIHPVVAEYNHFYTLDAYCFDYSLNYKHRFRKVINKELDKSPFLKHYFDDWGSRCYIFSSELAERQFVINKNEHIAVNHLEIDTNELKKLGCKYLLSSVDIKNHNSINLKYVGTYTTEDSYYSINVYQLI